MNQTIINNDLVPTYNVFKQKYTPQEKILLDELRENLVDIAISTGGNVQFIEDKLLNDIMNFLYSRCSN